MPESTHMLMWVMSDRAIPRSFRFMEGFRVHTFRLVNAGGESTFVKFHWKPKLGLQSVVWNEALKINGADPDFHRRDLWDAIEQGDYRSGSSACSCSTDEFADQIRVRRPRPTKIIPEELVPVRRVGRLVLDRLVDNFFAETEQVASARRTSCPASDFTNDRCCRAATSPTSTPSSSGSAAPTSPSCRSTPRSAPSPTFQQDGHMATVNPVSRANYEPNS